MNSAEILLPDSRGKIESLQTVRALAFLGIFTSHVGLSSLGAWGVSVFFVLSGFVMTYTYYNRSLETSFRSCIRFSCGKIRKLYLLHIIMMLAALALKLPLIIRDFSVKRIIFYLGEIFLNVTLLQTWVPSYAVYFSLNGVSWYLSVCLLLYAVFPIVLKVVKKMDCPKLILIMIIVYAIQIIIGFCSRFVSIPIQYFDNFSKWATYIFPLFRLGDFVIGCCLGKIFLNREWNIKKIVANGGELLWLLALCMTQYLFENGGGIASGEWFKYTMLYTPTSVIMIWLFAMKQGFLSTMLTCKPLVYLGNISAYTFLIHQIVIRYFESIEQRLIDNPMNAYIKFFMILCITILCSEIYRTLEDKIKNRKFVRSEAKV